MRDILNNRHFGYPEKKINRLQNIGYPVRNEFTSLSFNFRNGDGTGNEKSFPLSLPPGKEGEIGLEVDKFIYCAINIFERNVIKRVTFKTHTMIMILV